MGANFGSSCMDNDSWRMLDIFGDHAAEECSVYVVLGLVDLLCCHITGGLLLERSMTV